MTDTVVDREARRKGNALLHLFLLLEALGGFLEQQPVALAAQLADGGSGHTLVHDRLHHTIGNVTGHLVLGDDEIFGDRLGLFLFVRHGGGGGGAAAVGWRAVARKKSGSDAKKREVPYSLADER